MGISTNAHICYGITLDEEGVEFPWNEEGLEEWYCRTVHGIDFGGNYKAMLAFLKENPIPFRDENYCSGEYPLYILAVAGTVKTALRGSPTNFDPKDLIVDESSVEAFLKAVDLLGLEIDKSTIGWHLYSYMG
jgi:hypothetical protein